MTIIIKTTYTIIVQFWKYNHFAQTLVNHHYNPMSRLEWYSLLEQTWLCALRQGTTHGPLTRYIKWWVAHAQVMSGTFPPLPTSKETASYRSRHASRHVCHAHILIHVGIVNPRWRENIPGIPGACATCNFTYLAIGPLPTQQKAFQKLMLLLLWWKWPPP